MNCASKIISHKCAAIFCFILKFSVLMCPFPVTVIVGPAQISFTCSSLTFLHFPPLVVHHVSVSTTGCF